MKLKNKIALVTGASTGIGRAIAIEFAQEGAHVLLTARQKNKLNETKDQIQKVGGKCEVVPANLADTNSINDLVKTVKKKTKNVDILVNVAAIWHGENEVYAGKSLHKFSEKVIVDTYFVGTIAPTLLVHAFISHMPKSAKILNISGTFEDGAKGWLPYYVSKRAIEDLTVGLSEDLKENNIQVNCISPSDTATEEYQKHFPQYIKSAIDPKEIARQAVLLCSSESDNVTGTVWVMKKDMKPYEGYHS